LRGQQGIRRLPVGPAPGARVWNGPGGPLPVRAAGCSCDRGLQLLRGGSQPWGGEADRDVDPGDDRGDQ